MRLLAMLSWTILRTGTCCNTLDAAHGSKHWTLFGLGSLMPDNFLQNKNAVPRAGRPAAVEWTTVVSWSYCVIRQDSCIKKRSITYSMTTMNIDGCYSMKRCTCLASARRPGKTPLKGDLQQRRKNWNVNKRISMDPFDDVTRHW